MSSIFEGARIKMIDTQTGNVIFDSQVNSAGGNGHMTINGQIVPIKYQSSGDLKFPDGSLDPYDHYYEPVPSPMPTVPKIDICKCKELLKGHEDGCPFKKDKE